MQFPALALLELNSIALGIQIGDAMVKHSPVAEIYTGSIHSGKYLIMVTGDVATVEEAVKAGQAVHETIICDLVFLPNVHSDVVLALKGQKTPPNQDALGVIETHTVAAAILVADIVLKGTNVLLVKLQLADGLGGKGVVLFSGLVGEVETAIEMGNASIPDQLFHHAIIPQLHADMYHNVQTNRFGQHFGWQPL